MMKQECECRETFHDPRLVVLTGGPGAGKTALLEVIRRSFCRHVLVLPEAACIVFGGGFPRSEEFAMRMAAQRAIFHVQRELEDSARETRRADVILCDRGLLDGLAYWPATRESFLAAVGQTEDTVLARYAAVLHLQTPAEEAGYDHRDPQRIETTAEAVRLDAAIVDIWSRHPRRYLVEPKETFLETMQVAVDLLRGEVSSCCRHHALPLEQPRSAAAVSSSGPARQ